jgi:hypothetical protein
MLCGLRGGFFPRAKKTAQNAFFRKKSVPKHSCRFFGFSEFCLSIHSYPLAPSRSPKTPVYSGVWLGQLLGNTVLQPLEQMRSSISYSYRVQVVATPESCRPDRLNMKMPQQLNY